MNNFLNIKKLVIKKSKIASLLIYSTALCKLSPKNEIAKKRRINDFYKKNGKS